MVFRKITTPTGNIKLYWVWGNYFKFNFYGFNIVVNNIKFIGSLLYVYVMPRSVEKRKALKRAGSAKGQQTLVFKKVLLDDVVEVIPPSKLVYVFFSNFF